MGALRNGALGALLCVLTGTQASGGTVEVPASGGGSGTVTEVTGTSPIQVATGTTTPVVSVTGIANADIGAAAAIDATKIGAGGVTSTEFGYLATVTSDVQTQLGTKAAGAASSTDNALPRFDSTTGKVLQGSSVIVDDSNNVSGIGNLTASGVLTLDATIFLDNKGAENVWLGATGNTAHTTGQRNIVIGKGAAVSLEDGSNNVIIGRDAGLAVVSSSASQFIGDEAGRAVVNQGSVTAIGTQACYSGCGQDTVALGRGAGFNMDSGALRNAAIGRGSLVNVTTGDDNAAVGYQSCLTVETGSGNSCVGTDTVIGAAVSASLVLGRGASATVSNTAVAGSESYPLSTWTLGEGETTTTPSATTLQPSGGSGADVAGGNFVLAGGRGTGSGVGGSVLLQTAPAGASSSTLGTLATRLAVESNGWVNVGTGLSVGAVSSGTISPGIYYAAAADTACATTCATEPATLDSGSGTCLAAWNVKVPVACVDITADNCLCVGLH